MAYTITGRLRPGGPPVRLTWRDGTLSGPGIAVRAAVGPVTGPFTTTRHLADPLSALFLMTEVFHEISGQEGDVPSAPPVPPGTVA